MTNTIRTKSIVGTHLPQRHVPAQEVLRSVDDGLSLLAEAAGLEEDAAVLLALRGRVWVPGQPQAVHGATLVQVDALDLVQNGWNMHVHLNIRPESHVTSKNLHTSTVAYTRLHKNGIN